MTLSWKDATATGLTTLVVLVFAATHEAWNVPLVGDSHRWAAVAILVLGGVTCGLGSASEGTGWNTLSVLGVIALLLGMVAMFTGSLTALSLLVVAIVALWAGATVRHAVSGKQVTWPDRLADRR
jgi:hypothetical protein